MQKHYSFMERIEKIKLMLAEQPKDCFLKHALALEFIKMGQCNEAKAAFLQNLETDESYVATYYHLGKLYERLDEAEKAMDIYKKGIVVGQKQKDAHSVRELRAALDLLAG